MKTTAMVLVEAGRPLELVELSIPALKPGQVLVEIAYSGVCGTQVLEARGLKGEDRWLPHCLGHEGSGRVVDVGSAVTKVKPGDQVVLSWIRGSGIEAGGTVYDWNGRAVNAGGVTTFQRLSVVSENRLTPLPPGLPMDIAVLLGCAVPTGMGSIVNVLRVLPGESVVVFGTGGIGLNACMAASLAGAMPVIGVYPNPQRRALAEAYGASHTIDPTAGDPVAAIWKILPQGADAAVEATGQTAVMEQALRAVRAQGGRAVVIGNARHGATLMLDPSLLNQGKSLLGTWGGDAVPERDYPRFARLLSLARFDIRGLLSAPYRLEQTNQALDDLAKGRVGRPLINMHLV